MFGGSSNPFGQAPSNPFGSPNVFGQTNNTTANPFAPNPFGSATPFGAQTGASMFGGTSTGMFGAPPQSSPFGSVTTFGSSSSPAFGSSSPAFGATSSSPAFGASSSAFGGSSAFGQKPAFGGFGSTTPANPFGTTSQPSQPAFGSGLFGSTNPFGSQNQSTFGAASTPAFGSSSTPSFGVGSTPAFGSSTPFGATSSSTFGSTTFGSTGSAFGTSNTPLFGSGTGFGASTGSVFGSTSTPAFGASSVPAFGSSSTPAFGSSSTPAFGTTAFGASASSFNFSSSPSFGQSTSTFGATPFGSTSSTFGTQSSVFGTQPAAPFGSPGFGQGQTARGGSRAATYTPTNEADATGQPGKLESISAMPIFKDKSHEELRWEDYQLGDKGGSAPPSQSSGGIGFNTTPQSSSFNTSSPFNSTSSPFSTPNAFSFNKTPSFGNTSTSAFNPSPNPFSTSTPFMPTIPTSFSNTSPSFISGSQSTALTTPSFFNNSTPQSSGFNAQTLNPSSTTSSSSIFAPSSLFSSFQSSTGGFFSSVTPSTTSGIFSQASQSIPSLFQSPPSGFNFNPQTQSALSSPFPASGYSPNNSAIAPSSMTFPNTQPMPPSNPFGTLPPMPQMSIAQPGNVSNVEYGISTRDVVDKPPPIRLSSLLTSRHVSHRRTRVPPRRYNSINDSSMTSSFYEDDELFTRPKADAFFFPRENPRALVINHTDEYSLYYENRRSHQNGHANIPENGIGNPLEENPPNNKENFIVKPDIKSLLPKLKGQEYYTQPDLPELEAKERSEPGFLTRVKDFVVGRRGYGSIKFLGETDVRGIDLESIVQFNDREVIVYMDDSKKPAVGEGLNKTAVVSLLRIKGYDKATGREYSDGPKVEKYKAMLVRKTEEQGAEFVSYDPIKGEWKFKVTHFSKYFLGDVFYQ